MRRCILAWVFLTISCIAGVIDNGYAQPQPHDIFEFLTLDLYNSDTAWPSRYSHSMSVSNSDLHMATAYPEEALLFSTEELSFQYDLDIGVIPDDLRQELEGYGISLSQDATVSVEELGNRWLINDVNKTYSVNREGDRLNISVGGEFPNGSTGSLPTGTDTQFGGVPVRFWSFARDAIDLHKTDYVQYDFSEPLLLSEVYIMVNALNAYRTPTTYQGDPTFGTVEIVFDDATGFVEPLDIGRNIRSWWSGTDSTPRVFAATSVIEAWKITSFSQQDGQYIDYALDVVRLEIPGDYSGKKVSTLTIRSRDRTVWEQQTGVRLMGITLKFPFMSLSIYDDVDAVYTVSSELSHSIVHSGPTYPDADGLYPDNSPGPLLTGPHSWFPGMAIPFWSFARDAISLREGDWIKYDLDEPLKFSEVYIMINASNARIAPNTYEADPNFGSVEIVFGDGSTMVKEINICQDIRSWWSGTSSIPYEFTTPSSPSSSNAWLTTIEQDVSYAVDNIRINISPEGQNKGIASIRISSKNRLVWGFPAGLRLMGITLSGTGEPAFDFPFRVKEISFHRDSGTSIPPRGYHMGKPYRLRIVIKNESDSLQEAFEILSLDELGSRSELHDHKFGPPTPPPTPDSPAPNYYNGSLVPSDKSDVWTPPITRQWILPGGELSLEFRFEHKWDWIEGKTFFGVDFLEGLLASALMGGVGTIENWKLLELVSDCYKGLEKVESYSTMTMSEYGMNNIVMAYTYIHGTETSPGIQVGSSIQLRVHSGKICAYWAYLFFTVFNAPAAIMSALFTGPTLVGAMIMAATTSVINECICAFWYTVARDPADMNYEEIAIPLEINLPELEEIPESSQKEWTLYMLDLYSITQAMATSWDRYMGAVQAGEISWQLAQLHAAANYSNQTAGILDEMHSLINEMEQQGFMLSNEELQTAYDQLKAEGFPQELVNLFLESGFTEEKINDMQNSMLDAWLETIEAFDGEASRLNLITQALAKLGNALAAEAIKLQHSLKIDEGQPITNIVASGAQGILNCHRSDVAVALQAFDIQQTGGIVYSEYSLDNGEMWRPYVGEIWFSISGRYTILARSTNKVGNIENPPASSTFIVDKEMPTIDILTPQVQSYEQSGGLKLQYRIRDEISGINIATEKAMLDGEAVERNQVINLASLGSGEHHFQVSVSDLAGNSAEESITFFVGSDLIKGGGWFTHNELKSSLMVEVTSDGGIIGPTSFIKYFDQQTRTYVRNTSVASLSITQNQAIIIGSCSLNEVTGHSYTVTITDDGLDSFSIEIRNAGGAIVHSNSGSVSGGDIKVLKAISVGDQIP